MQVLILGANGFIGSNLVRTILGRTDWPVVGLDLSRDRLRDFTGHPKFRFVEADIADHERVDNEIDGTDVVLPLVAIARPRSYVRRPLDVFSLTFEENLRIVRRCVEMRKRLVFPSSSEVYGMCADDSFVEDRSNLVLGPIHCQRWIYACSKQLLERVIWAYGKREGLDFTVIRPFNWIGPGLDDSVAREGGSRVVRQFIADLADGKPIRLVDGGWQRRCFTYIDDGIDCLLRILQDPERCRGKIFNIGNPDNDCSVRELADKLVGLFRRHAAGARPELVEVSPDDYYGEGYQDTPSRVPSIERAATILGWKPRVGLDEALERTLRAYVGDLTPAGS